MRHYRLKEEERALHGYTDLVIVEHTDFAEDTDDTAETITILALAANDIVRGDVVADVRTAVAGLTACTLDVGRGSAGNSNAYHDGVDATTAQAYAATADPARVDGTEELSMTLDPASNGENLGETSAGEIWVWANIWRESDRAPMSA